MIKIGDDQFIAVFIGRKLKLEQCLPAEIELPRICQFEETNNHPVGGYCSCINKLQICSTIT